MPEPLVPAPVPEIPRALAFARILFAAGTLGAAWPLYIVVASGGPARLIAFWSVMTALNAGIAIWLWKFPRTARLPAIAGLLFKIVGSGLAIYFAHQRSAALFGANQIFTWLTGIIAIWLLIELAFGENAKRYFQARNQ